MRTGAPCTLVGPAVRGAGTGSNAAKSHPEWVIASSPIAWASRRERSSRTER